MSSPDNFPGDLSVVRSSADVSRQFEFQILIHVNTWKEVQGGVECFQQSTKKKFDELLAVQLLPLGSSSSRSSVQRPRFLPERSWLIQAEGPEFIAQLRVLGVAPLASQWPSSAQTGHGTWDRAGSLLMQTTVHGSLTCSNIELMYLRL